MNEYPASGDKVAGLEEYVGYGHKTNNTQRDTWAQTDITNKNIHMYTCRLWSYERKPAQIGLFWLQLKQDQREIYWKNIEILNTLKCKQY